MSATELGLYNGTIREYLKTHDHYPTEHFMKQVEKLCLMDKWTKDWLDTCRKIKDRKKRAVMIVSIYLP